MSEAGSSSHSADVAHEIPQDAHQLPLRRSRELTRWAVVVLLSLGMIVAYVDRSNISVALTAEEFKEFFRLTRASPATQWRQQRSARVS